MELRYEKSSIKKSYQLPLAPPPPELPPPPEKPPELPPMLLELPPEDHEPNECVPEDEKVLRIYALLLFKEIFKASSPLKSTLNMAIKIAIP